MFTVKKFNTPLKCFDFIIILDININKAKDECLIKTGLRLHEDVFKDLPNEDLERKKD